MYATGGRKIPKSTTTRLQPKPVLARSTEGTVHAAGRDFLKDLWLSPSILPTSKRNTSDRVATEYLVSDNGADHAVWSILCIDDQQYTEDMPEKSDVMIGD